MSLQRSLSAPRMMEDKISWAMMATEDYYPQIPLDQWQSCHFTYLSHYYFDHQQSISQILSRMFLKPKFKKFSYCPDDKIYNHQIQVIDSYFDLMTITQDLNVCTAVRKDLVEGFLNGEHLRYKVINDEGKTVAVFAFLHQSSNFQRKKYFKSLNFEIYALGHNHKELGHDEAIESKIFHLFMKKHGLKIVQSYDSV